MVSNNLTLTSSSKQTLKYDSPAPAGSAGSAAEVHTSQFGARGARMQPLTCVPEADETKTMTVAWPHHACMPPSEQRQHRAARSTCALRMHWLCAPRATPPTWCSSPGAAFSSALHTSADSLAAADHLMREGAVCTRLCTRHLRSCHAAPVWYGSELEL